MQLFQFSMTGTMTGYSGTTVLATGKFKPCIMRLIFPTPHLCRAKHWICEDSDKMVKFLHRKHPNAVI